MTPRSATIIRLITTFICLDIAIVLTAINSKISATVVVLLIGAAICSRIKMDIEQ